MIHPLYSEAHGGCGQSRVSNMSKKLRKYPRGQGDRKEETQHEAGGAAPPGRTPERRRRAGSSLVPHAVDGTVVHCRTAQDGRRWPVRKALNTVPHLIQGLAATTRKARNRRRRERLEAVGTEAETKGGQKRRSERRKLFTDKRNKRRSADLRTTSTLNAENCSGPSHRTLSLKSREDELRRRKGPRAHQETNKQTRRRRGLRLCLSC